MQAESGAPTSQLFTVKTHDLVIEAVKKVFLHALTHAQQPYPLEPAETGPGQLTYEGYVSPGFSLS